MVTNNYDFKTITRLRMLCMKVLPTVYGDALSYEEQVCKVTEKINELVNTVNALPDYIIEIVKELIEAAGLENIIKQVLADLYFINVKNPPTPLTAARGDGVTSDTDALQAMISYVNQNGGYLFFPAGTYAVSGLTMIENVSLIGLNRYDTIIKLTSNSNKSLITGTIENATISDITLDANINGQNTNISVINGTVTNCVFYNVIFKDGYDSVTADISGYNQLTNIIFDGIIHDGLILKGNNTVIVNLAFENVSSLNSHALVNITGDSNVIDNIVSVETIPNGIIITGNNNVIKGIINNAVAPFTNNGNFNTIDLYGAEKTQSYAKNVSENIGGNMTKNIGGTNTENNQTTKTVNVTGVNTENNSNNKNVTVAGAFTENISTKHIAGKEVFIDTTDPLKYGTVENSRVKFTDKNGNAYNLITDTFSTQGSVLYNDFIVNDIVSHSPDWFTDTDTLKDLTSDQVYSMYDNMPKTDLIKTSIGTDNEGKTIYAYKHVAYYKTGLNTTTFLTKYLNSKSMLLISGQHGTEKQAIITLFRWLNDEYQKDYSYLLQNYDIMIVPCASPTNIDESRYYNANGVNPNRNFPAGFTPSATSGQTPLDQAQCKALYDYLYSLIGTYGYSMMVFNFHNSYYFEHHDTGESRILWFNMNANTSDMAYVNNMLKSTARMRYDILSAYPDLDGTNFNRFLGTVQDGTFGGQVSATGCRFVLAESPMRWTQDGEWYDQRTGYINYIILYTTIKACTANEFDAPFLRRYNQLGQIGCSTDNTLQQVCNALPSTCELSVLLSGSKNSTLAAQLPARNIFTGLLKIIKEYETDRCVITFSVADGTRVAQEWSCSYDSDYGLSQWQPHFAEMSNVNFDMTSLTISNLFDRIGNSAVVRVVPGHAMYSILPVQSAGMLFAFAPILPADFTTRVHVCFFVSDNGGFYINNNNVPTASNWTTIKAPA